MASLRAIMCKAGGWIVIITCYCCRQAQQPVLFCKHSSDPEKSVQYLCNIIVITQIVCTFLLNGGMTKPGSRLICFCYCFHYTHLGPPLSPFSRQDLFFNDLTPCQNRLKRLQVYKRNGYQRLLGQQKIV